MQVAIIAIGPTITVITSSDLRLTAVTGAHLEVNDYVLDFRKHFSFSIVLSLVFIHSKLYLYFL